MGLRAASLAVLAVIAGGCDGEPLPPRTVPEEVVVAPDVARLPPMEPVEEPGSSTSEPILGPPPDAPPDPVRAALDWLARHQSEDGSWTVRGRCPECGSSGGDGSVSPVPSVEATALAVNAFLANFRTHRDREYGNTVRRGLKFLKSVQDADGCFDPRYEPRQPRVHALATVALLDAFGQTQSPLFEGPSRDGIRFLLVARKPGKDWGDAAPGDPFSMEQDAWAVMVVRWAQVNGIAAAPGVLEEVKAWLDSRQVTWIGDQPGPEEMRESAAMLACIRVWCGAKRGDPAVEAVADEVGRFLCERGRGEALPSARTVYFGTFLQYMLSAHGSRICTEWDRHGGPLPGTRRWFRWREARESALPAWLRLRATGCERGSWEDGARLPGRVESTALAAMAAALN